MAISKFEDAAAWEKGQNLAVLVYASFSQLKDYAFKDQICRASVSISSNVAEGFDRQSNKEFIRFLYIALGSCSETKSLLYLAKRLKFCTDADHAILMNQANEVAKIIHGLINSMKIRS